MYLILFIKHDINHFSRIPFNISLEFIQKKLFETLQKMNSNTLPTSSSYDFSPNSNQKSV